MGKEHLPERIKIGALNCHGIKEKIDYPEFFKLVSEVDVFGVSETWLCENDTVHIPGFKFYPMNRKKEKVSLLEIQLKNM